MAESYTKAKLIAELSASGKLTKADAGRLLDQLAAIAYREAVNGFVMPGICKLKVIEKKASRRRNPITGQTILIGERKALKIVPLKRAKTAIVPNTDVVVQILEATTTSVVAVEPHGTEVLTPTSAQPPENTAAPRTAPEPTPHTASPEGEEGQIVFPCGECGSLLAATPKMAGQNGECPFCKAQTVIPLRNPSATPSGKIPATGPASLAKSIDFVLFICRSCGQEIEAPTDMIGLDVECPTCGTGLTVPLLESPKSQIQPGLNTPDPKGARSSMTIRIDLSDLE